MADELDRLIRAAMKTLDDQVPSGYFEALPNRTIARLEGSSMQHGSSGTTETHDTVGSPPPMAVDEHQAPTARPSVRDMQDDENSGLHDIRNLAQSTKQRLSSRRISVPPFEEDVLASSSGSFKNIALPQPAKMVSLPELAELPSVAEVKKAEKAAKAEKAKAKEAVAAVEAPAASTASAPTSFALPSQQKKSKAPLLAIAGVGVAAAAGAVIYLQTSKSAAPATTPAATEAVAVAPAAPAEPPPPPPAAAPVVTPIEEPPAAPAVEAVATGALSATADEGKADESDDAKLERKGARKGKKADKSGEQPEKAAAVEKPAPTTKPEPTKKAEPAAKASGDDGEPSFEQLLKEAGVEERKETKPKLDKKSLTTSDFKNGMAGPTAKAKGCYRGNQGTAMIKLTIDPSGKVSKVAVTGQFAGTPEASCVESAIREATFPPWDGGPQSFTYSVLLSD